MISFSEVPKRTDSLCSSLERFGGMRTVLDTVIRTFPPSDTARCLAREVNIGGPTLDNNDPLDRCFTALLEGPKQVRKAHLPWRGRCYQVLLSVRCFPRAE